jgi:hypothetical protein
MAYKVFSNGDALTGGELNTYLMNQSVIQFASTTARDAAIPAPSEGQLVWLQDSNKYVYYSGSAWADLITPPASGNLALNGGFDIWQRGTSTNITTVSNTYAVDRWNTTLNQVTSGTLVVKQNTADKQTTDNYCLEIDATGVVTTSTLYHTQIFETLNVVPLRGKTITLSFSAKVASGSGTFISTLRDGTDVNGFPVTSSTETAANHTVTTSWQRFTVSHTVQAGANSLVIRFTTPSAFAGKLYLSQVQLEVGGTATAFKRNGVNIENELAGCQRYYQRFNSINTYGLFGFGKAYNGNTLNLVFSLPVQMRSTPNAIETSAMSTIQYETGSTSGNTPTSITLNAFTSTPSIVGCDLNKSGAFSTGAFYFVQAANSASAYIAFGAEL